MKKSLQSKKVLLSLAATSALWSGFAVAGVEITPTVDISNMYLYRGTNLSCDYGDCGNAQISGGVKVNMDGFYGGVWGTSAADGEYDLYTGYNHAFSDKMSLDVSAWTYIYPHGDNATSSLPSPRYDDPGKYSEIIVTLSYDMFWGTVIDNVADAEGYMYYAVGGTYDKFGATLGMADPDTTRHEITSFAQVVNDYTHLDLSYQATDNVKFIVSKIIQQDEFELSGVEQEKFRDDDTKFVLIYSVPLK